MTPEEAGFKRPWRAKKRTRCATPWIRKIAPGALGDHHIEMNEPIYERFERAYGRKMLYCRSCAEEKASAIQPIEGLLKES